MHTLYRAIAAARLPRGATMRCPQGLLGTAARRTTIPLACIIAATLGLALAALMLWVVTRVGVPARAVVVIAATPLLLGLVGDAVWRLRPARAILAEAASPVSNAGQIPPATHAAAPRGSSLVWRRPEVFMILGLAGVLSLTAMLGVAKAASSAPSAADLVRTFIAGTGGSLSDHTKRAVVLADDDIVVAGETDSQVWPAQAAPFDASQQAGSNIFVTRYDRATGAIIWSRIIGGRYDEGVTGLVSTADGRVCLAGFTTSTNFPTTPGAALPANNYTGPGALNGYVACLAQSDGALLAATLIGGSGGPTRPVGLAADPTTGELLVAGMSDSIDLQNPGYNQASAVGPIFVQRLRPDLTARVWTWYYGGGYTTVGGSYQSQLTAIAAAPDGGFFLTGYAAPYTITTTTGAFKHDWSTDHREGFVMRALPGWGILSSTLIAPDTWPTALAVGGDGVPVVTGGTQSPSYPTSAGAWKRSLESAVDQFVFKPNAAFSGLAYSTLLGGTAMKTPVGLAIGPGGVYVAGMADLTMVPGGTPGTFPRTADALIATDVAAGPTAYLAVLSLDGAQLRYASFLEPLHTHYADGLALDLAGNAVVVGATDLSFQTTPGAPIPTYQGGPIDGFLLVTRPGGGVVAAPSPTPAPTATRTPSPTATATRTKTPTPTATRTPTAAPAKVVRPILECVAPNNDGTLTAYFGYQNDWSAPLTIIVGSKNRFTPSPSGQGQPGTFQVGRVSFAFKVKFDGSPLTWALTSPDGTTRTATASSASSRCP